MLQTNLTKIMKQPTTNHEGLNIVVATKSMMNNPTYFSLCASRHFQNEMDFPAQSYKPPECSAWTASMTESNCWTVNSTGNKLDALTLA